LLSRSLPRRSLNITLAAIILILLNQPVVVRQGEQLEATKAPAGTDLHTVGTFGHATPAA
jgi:hypothetical protein